MPALSDEILEGFLPLLIGLPPHKQLEHVRPDAHDVGEFLTGVRGDDYHAFLVQLAILDQVPVAYTGCAVGWNVLLIDEGGVSGVLLDLDRGRVTRLEGSSRPRRACLSPVLRRSDKQRRESGK